MSNVQTKTRFLNRIQDASRQIANVVSCSFSVSSCVQLQLPHKGVC